MKITSRDVSEVDSAQTASTDLAVNDFAVADDKSSCRIAGNRD
jgi:hypothetical protein